MPGIRFIRAVLQRQLGSHPVYVWLLWALATAVLAFCPILFSDPGMWPFIFDPEMLALIVVVCVKQSRLQLAILLLTLRDSLQRVRR